MHALPHRFALYVTLIAIVKETEHTNAYTVPPVTVAIIAGCGKDLLINILLTLLGVLPGTVHALYLVFVYFRSRERNREGLVMSKPAPPALFAYSKNLQAGGDDHQIEGHDDRAVEH
ncbi:hypothetical protein F66182_39 [Fusarium sp. NRRL 66182]|nr:hypothetical protein F66182_39 [Fusarium sp. NRRL 66182]